MDSLSPGCTWIHVNPAPTGVVPDKQQVGMSTDEQVRTMVIEAFTYALGVSARPPTDVGHPYGQTFPYHVLMLWKVAAKQLIIDVAMNGHEWGHAGQGI